MQATKGPYNVDELPFDIVVQYLKRMGQFNRKKKQQQELTDRLLAQIRRPVNLFPLVRLLYPKVSCLHARTRGTGLHLTAAGCLPTTPD